MSFRKEILSVNWQKNIQIIKNLLLTEVNLTGLAQEK